MYRGEELVMHIGGAIEEVLRGRPLNDLRQGLVAAGLRTPEQFGLTVKKVAQIREAVLAERKRRFVLPELMALCGIEEEATSCALG